MEHFIITRDNNYLEHHGVKGQKWGVRKQQETSSKDNKQKEVDEYEQKQRKKKAIIIASALIVAGAATVAIVARKNKGKSAKKVVANNPQLVSKGKEYVTGVSKDIPANLASSRRLGIHGYMGKNRIYNIYR